MASNWIRVDASIGRDARLAHARRILGISRPAMVGMHVLLEAELLAHHATGVLTDVDISTLAEWAGFDGDLKHFAKAIEALSDKEGRLAGWEERHDVLIHRLEREAKRKREARDAQRVAREGENPPKKASEGRPKDVRRTSEARPSDVRTQRNGTERDGTGRTEISEASERSNKRTLGVERGAANDGDDSASLRSNSKTPATALPPIAAQFLDRYYPVVGRRRADVERQLLKLAGGIILTIGKGQYVQAYDVERLEAKCQEVIDDAGIRDLNAAIAILFAKLGDTGDGSAPGDREAEGLDHTPSDVERSYADAVLDSLPSVD